MCKAPKPGTGAPIALHRKAFEAGKNDPVKRALGITKTKKRQAGGGAATRGDRADRSAYSSLFGRPEP